ncbi:telomerase-binding protein EST1A [Nymphalis io]|uniref:telomerase-binding protein EST1A n=1 Tax=Inachis io TaxID=171585 RepID=UPI002167D184|nr:telomerase-binding protein EST1A [Nymphalis io]
MDDDYKDYKKVKRQQKLYKPGSGPLRRSRYGLDAKMDSYDLDNSPKGRDAHYGSQHSVNGEDVNVTCREVANTRHRKPEQQLYVPRTGDSYSDIDKQSKASSKCDNTSQYNKRRSSAKQDNHTSIGDTGPYSKDSSQRDCQYRDNDGNYNRHYRQGSEARSVSPSQSLYEQKSLDRNRDSRSMETWAGRHKSRSGGKPPSGRRNSAGFTSDSRPKHINLDNIPPRFRKKYLEQSGHQSFDSVDQLNKDRYSNNDMTQSSSNSGPFYNSSDTNWSQTLPSRGRGRLRENENFDREKFINSYLKNYEVQNSRRSTPSNSYMNLHEPNALEKSGYDKSDSLSSDYENKNKSNDRGSKNGISRNDTRLNHTEQDSREVDSSENHNDSESISQISTNLSEMTNLDWTEEVEKNIKLDDLCDSSASFSQSTKPSNVQENKTVEQRDSRRNGRPRRRDKRSSSRGNRNPEKKERNRKDSNVSIQYEPERNRKDSNVSIHHEAMAYGLKQRERERRDSHRSNRSSTIGNSRDDLDRWRSLRSYSREQSSERMIVSQCNSRDTSTHRAASPKDIDGFRVPSSASKSGTWTSANQKKNNSSWNGGRGPSIERKHSPTPSAVSEAGEGAGGAGGGAGGARRSRKHTGRRRRHADAVQPPAPHPPGAQPAPTNVNWRDEIIESKKHHVADRQSESTNHRNRLNSVLSEKSTSESTSHPGLIILPQSSISHMQKDQGRGSSDTQKTLFDHHNPSKPIIVQTSPMKHDVRLERASSPLSGSGRYEAGDAQRGARHVSLLQKVDRADAVLKMHTLRGPLALSRDWPDVADTRKFLQGALERLLTSDLKYCQADNIEHQFWKILYYHFIENLRKSISTVTPEEKPEVVKLINTIIEEGNVFFENLVQTLEKTYKFNTEDYINDNHVLPPKGLGYVGLALISVQKLYVFLGDLARYKEQVNETNNYAKSKFWYTKAQLINPKNGRPYNQLAILAIYARRKLDAVYYYMRSLMSSNPFQSARESLLSLFEENRKKYEAAERKRQAAAEAARGESACAGLRREVWVRAGGQRTTTLSADDALASMTPVELNKNFITSYLHVHGKLITKIDMESFHASAAQMLRQFRALLHRQPLPTPAARLLQLTALNMFAVETTAASLKGKENGGERTAWLECALGVSLLMFGALLERCCALLPEPAHTQQHADALLLLPAIKVWSDWMLCHSSIWNPPPSLDNFEIENDSDPWDWLAKLMNILEDLDDKSIQFESEMKEGLVCVRLPEDASLAGFTPLMYMEPAAAWLRPAPAAAPHSAEHALRTRKLLFFGTEYLVGVEPPVLKLEYPDGSQPRYVSAVQHAKVNYAPLQQLTEDSGDDDSASGMTSGPTSLSEELPDGADETTRKLLRRKEQLESRKATLEQRRQRMQEMLSSSWVSVEVEVRPRWLVPDTNCFIDHLPLLQAVAAAPGQPYQLAVPLVVVSELEGLRRCARVGGAAREALAWLTAGGGGVRLATARGSLLAARGVAFAAEHDAARGTNDDRVLATALNLHANLTAAPALSPTPNPSADPPAKATANTAANTAATAANEGAVGRLREVVLLTDDRNLRVKALAAELPARDLPSFVHWAGLHPDRLNTNTETATPSPDV